MAEENPSTIDFDLNLVPLNNSRDGGEPGSGPYPIDAMNLENLLDGPVHMIREVVRHRGQRWRSLSRQLPVPLETRNLALELIGGDTQQTGESSVASEERPTELAKLCENGNGYVEDNTLGKKDDAGKNNDEGSSFFDCNICFDLSNDPVVTCCGHLFCWACLYRWLHHHSGANECPVCKGEVTVKNVTPIYGRGNNAQKLNVDCSLEIPHRPQAQRAESSTQVIPSAALTVQMLEMIRDSGVTTVDLNGELPQLQSQNSDAHRELLVGLSSDEILTSRGIYTEWTPAELSDLFDLMESSPPDYESRDNHQLSSMSRGSPPNYEASDNRPLSSMLRDGPPNYRHSSMLLRRTNPLREAALSILESAMDFIDETSDFEPLVDESYFHSDPVERSLELPSPFDDRDFISSIAAAIHSESQTLDNATEIDSTMAISTSSSRRRNDAARISDFESGDSRAPRRRRLH